MSTEEWDHTSHHRYPPDEIDNPIGITLRWKVIDGRFEVVAVELRNPHALDDAAIRKIRWGRVFREARDTLRRHTETTSSERFVESVADAGHDAVAYREAAEVQATAAKAPGRRQIYGPDHWLEVARVYREAFAVRDPAPTKAVHEHFAGKGEKVSRNQAGKWVSRCRELGYLPPTEKRKPKA